MGLLSRIRHLTARIDTRDPRLIRSRPGSREVTDRAAASGRRGRAGRGISEDPSADQLACLVSPCSGATPRQDGSVTYPDWREPVRRLRATTGPATAEQLRIAAAVGCPPHNNEPCGDPHRHDDRLAQAGDASHGNDPSPPTDRQRAFLERLGHGDAPPEMHRPVASAWIDHYLSVRTAHALENLELKAGDEVHRQRDHVDPSTGEVVELGGTVTVSSIGSNGLVYFRGGNGQCGWPTNLRRISES